MKIIISIIMSVLLAMSFVVATPENNQGVGNIHNECKAHGFDYGIVKYSCDNKEVEGDEEAVSVNWITKKRECKAVSWTSEEEIAGVLSKEATRTYSHPGGVEGYFTKTRQQSISHITFCGNDVEEVPEEDVPEFGVIAGALVLAGAGLFLYKKRP